MRLITILLFVLCATGVAMAQTPNRAELEQQRAEIQKEIAKVKASLDQTQKNKKTSLGQYSLVQKRLKLREAAINNINKQIDYIEDDINRSRAEIVKLKGDLDTLRIQYEKSVVYAYKNRSNYDFLNFIFSASNFNDALKRVQYLKSYRAYREDQTRAIKNTQELLQKKIDNLETNRKQKDVALEKKQQEKEVLDRERKEKSMVIDKLKSREKELSRELSSKQSADNKLRASIRAAIDREIRIAKAKAEEERKARVAAAKAAGVTAENTVAAAEEKEVEIVVASKSVFDATPGGEIISDNFEKNKGKLPWPIDNGNIKIHFGRYSIPGTKLSGTNPGLTLETDHGSYVRCVFDGEVVSVFDVEGESNVLVRHGKYFTTYGNLSNASVGKGEKVKAGQVVGKASSNADGNGEIEFLLLQENRNLDPADWIKRR